MIPQRRAELINEWKVIAAQLNDIDPHSPKEQKLRARQDAIAVELGEEAAKKIIPRTES